MIFFTGEYASKLDAKGRLVLPARFKSQLPARSGGELVLRKGFESCLVLYPMAEFKKIFFKISELSEFNGEYRKLQRNFFSGTATVEPDSNGRFIIPKTMLTHSHIDREAVLVGTGTKVEIWDPDLYQRQKIKDPDELSALAQKYLNE